MTKFLAVHSLGELLNPVAGFFDWGLIVGQFGVGLFFVISGYVIPKSLQYRPCLQFLYYRFWRLWPTYAIGFLVSFLVLSLLYLNYGNGEWRYLLIEIVVHFLLGLRDLVGTSNIDGIIWTLEIEIKFYITISIFYLAFLKRYVLGTVVITTCAFMLSWPLLSLSNVGNASVVVVPATALLLFANLIILMNIGTVVWLYDSNYVDLRSFIILLMSHVAIFFVCQTTINWGVGEPWVIKTVYLAAAFLFIILRNITQRHFPFFDWLGKISYPLYIVHGCLGYGVLYVAIKEGISAPIALIFSILVVIITSYILHIFVERPLMMSKKL